MKYETKKKLKKYLVLGIILAIIALYLAMLTNSIIRHQVLSASPLVIFQWFFKEPFPAGPFLLWYLIVISICAYALWKNKRETARDDPFLNHKYSSSTVYGSAGWLEPADAEKEHLIKIESPVIAKDTILGQVDSSNKNVIMPESLPNKHLAGFGSSGSGKSTAYARNFIFQGVRRRESMVVTDPSGELATSMAEYCRDNGYVVKVLNLIDPEHSDGWNALKEIAGSDLNASIFSNVVIANTGTGKGDVWDNAAESLLKALLLRVERDPTFASMGNQNIGTAYEMIQNPEGEEHLDTFFRGNMPKEAQCAIGPYMTFKQASPNMRGNIIVGLASRLGVLQNDIVKRLLATDDIDLTLPGKKPCIYFCLKSVQHHTMDFVLTLFFSFLFLKLADCAKHNTNNKGKLDVPVSFLLDEFTNVGVFPNFTENIAEVRKYDMSISILFQDIGQLRSRYFESWESILSNCATWLCFGCNDKTTADYMSERAGVGTVKVETVQKDKNEPLLVFSRRRSQGEGRRNVVNSDEILRTPKDECIIQLQGQNMMKAKKFFFWNHPEYKKLRDWDIMSIPNIFDAAARYEYKKKEDLRVEKFEEWWQKEGKSEREKLEERFKNENNAHGLSPLSSELIKEKIHQAFSHKKETPTAEIQPLTDNESEPAILIAEEEAVEEMDESKSISDDDWVSDNFDFADESTDTEDIPDCEEEETANELNNEPQATQHTNESNNASQGDYEAREQHDNKSISVSEQTTAPGKRHRSRSGL